MHWDGDVLPTPAETAVLHDFLLVLSDALPNLAARWLAADTADTPAVRSLAGADRGDPWTVEGLLAATLNELRVTAPTTTIERRAIAVEWVARRWLQNGDTRSAVSVLCHLAMTHLESDLGLDEFMSLENEWRFPGTWGRSQDELELAATQLLTGFLRAAENDR